MNRQIKLRFATKDEAIAYAERNGLAYRVEEPKLDHDRRTFSYSDNFKTSRRSDSGRTDLSGARDGSVAQLDRAAAF